MERACQGHSLLHPSFLSHPHFHNWERGGVAFAPATAVAPGGGRRLHLHAVQLRPNAWNLGPTSVHLPPNLVLAFPQIGESQGSLGGTTSLGPSESVTQGGFCP